MSLFIQIHSVRLFQILSMRLLCKLLQNYAVGGVAYRAEMALKKLRIFLFHKDLQDKLDQLTTTAKLFNNNVKSIKNVI